MIGANDATEILWVESGRESNRVNKIAEHDRQLATLGLIQWLPLRFGCGLDATGAVATSVVFNNKAGELPLARQCDKYGCSRILILLLQNSGYFFQPPKNFVDGAGPRDSRASQGPMTHDIAG
jgi:hypothetical protein